MSTPSFFRARLNGMADPSHPVAVLASRLPWERIQATMAPKFSRRDRPTQGGARTIHSASERSNAVAE